MFSSFIADEWCFGCDGRKVKWFLCGNVKPIIQHWLESTLSRERSVQRNMVGGLSFRRHDRRASSAFNRGFTLIELIVTLTVAGILAAVAIPWMSDFIIRTRVSGNVNEFIAATMLARSEAIQRNGAVTICRSTGAETGSNACDTSASDWSSGWLVFVGTTATGPTAATILARQGAFPTGTAITPAAVATSITYNANGAPLSAPPTSFAFTFGSFSRTVCFGPSGRTSALAVGSTSGCPT
ncbi:MAG: GspH/FimT family pseudopilin [Collimonas pratensis]|uniref:GspH/FimT family pseudopilin n=1 Tax=Collimonas pratensis TaxID=279113 RepID=UPI003C7880AE